MKNKGFTLIELMTAIAIFGIVMTISMGSIISVFDASRKSRSLKTVMSNLNLALESMSKEMRYGTNYHCGSGGEISSPQNCPSGDTFLSFLSNEDKQITYRLNGTAIEKKIDSDIYIPITAPELVIDSLTFYTLGALNPDDFQPKVIMRVKSHAGIGDDRTDFTLQTMVSQRVPDMPETP